MSLNNQRTNQELNYLIIQLPSPMRSHFLPKLSTVYICFLKHAVFLAHFHIRDLIRPALYLIIKLLMSPSYDFCNYPVTVRHFSSNQVIYTATCFQKVRNDVWLSHSVHKTVFSSTPIDELP
jgi:hypothetical protein